ncbi:MAG: amino acid adenylation domain-containing protein, partial [Cytophagales bacterium]|nr:amino acid adenylation domain-containing protein [Cytophagales bacterium]
ASEMGVSFKSICLAAYLKLLHVVSAENDVVVGVVSHDRPALEDVEKIVGCFLNVVPVRMQLAEEQDEPAFIKRVNEQLAEIRTHEIHLTEIAKAVGMHADNRGNPLFDCLLNVVDFHTVSEWQENAGISINSDVLGMDMTLGNEGMTNTLFDLEISKTYGSLVVQLKYKPAYFEEEEMEYALTLYLRILENFAAGNPGTLRPEDLMTEAERLWMQEEFNATHQPYAQQQTLHGLMEAQCERTPRAVALRQEGRQLSYSQLNCQANQLAHHLLQLGLQPGEKVGLLTGRDFPMIVGMYAILKAGAAYVPIDPAYPLERQHYLMENAAIRLVLTDQLPPPDQLPSPVHFVPLEAGRWQDCPTTNPALEQSSRALAYVIYTSGSTGRPKGVMIAHHQAVNLVEWVNHRFGVGPDDRLLFITSMCFDLSVYDVFGVLACGGSLVIARQEQVQDVQQLQRLLTQEQITFWDSVPTTLNYLVSELETAALPYRHDKLRLVFMSGDWIPVQLPARLKAYFPQAQVISLGGATEGTVWSNYYPIEQVAPHWTSIPYGKPIANNYFYVLDAGRRPVPRGVVGELYIGGAGVALGYLNQPDKTAHAFVADPFSQALGGRMYRTGDLGRILPDGNMEFLGRRDHQVKIRGYRVELGEIESQLLSHPSVSQAVVADRTDQQGVKFLVAYYVSEETIPSTDLRTHLAVQLPNYMVPSLFCRIKQIPLNTNGKIDRQALPDPDPQNTNGSESFVAPVTPTQKQLARIWAEVLDNPNVGIEDNFFELGGHSLKATQVVARVYQDMRVKIELRNLFLYPTVYCLSQVIDAVGWLAEPKAVAEGAVEEFVL